jgi:hypothetical protein
MFLKLRQYKGYVVVLDWKQFSADALENIGAALEKLGVYMYQMECGDDAFHLFITKYLLSEKAVTEMTGAYLEKYEE